MKTQVTKIILICLFAAMGASGWVCKQCLAESGNTLSNGLVMYLSFDKVEMNDGNVRILDSSGHNNHGTLTSGKFAPGKIGNAFQCMAINRNDGIIVKDSDSLDLDAVSIAVWINTQQADGQWNRILDKSWRTGYNLCVGGDYEGKTYRQKISFETVKQCLYSKSNIVDGQWHFIVGTYDGKTSRIYIDGNLNSERESKEPHRLEHNDVDLRIAQLAVPEPHPDDNAFFDGLIDEVRVYNRVLSAQEVQALYQLQTAD